MYVAVCLLTRVIETKPPEKNISFLISIVRTVLVLLWEANIWTFYFHDYIFSQFTDRYWTLELMLIHATTTTHGSLNEVNYTDSVNHVIPHSRGLLMNIRTHIVSCDQNTPWKYKWSMIFIILIVQTMLLRLSEANILICFYITTRNPWQQMSNQHIVVLY